MFNPPATDGTKVFLTDPDHFGVTLPTRGSRAWAWKSFTRGMNPAPLDTLPSYIRGGNGGAWGCSETPHVLECQAAMGHTRAYANKMDLAMMIPHNELSSTTYCLAKPGSEYLVYQPERDGFTVILTEGTYAVEWFDAAAGKVIGRSSKTVTDGTWSFIPPVSFDSVLYLKREN